MPPLPTVPAMTSLPNRHLRSTAICVALLLGLAACGSSDSSFDDASDTNATSEAVDESPVETVVEPAAEPVVEAEPEPSADTSTDTGSEPAPEAASTGGGDVAVSLDDGRSWTLDATFCAFDADATGPAAAIVNIAGQNDDGAEVNILEAWPFDGSTENGPSFIANFVDEDENLYVMTNGSATMSGDAVEVTASYYTDVFYEEGQTPDGSIVVSCQP